MPSRLDGRSDLKTNLLDVSDGFDYTNLTNSGNYSARPKILINGKPGSDSGGDQSLGTIDLISELYKAQRLSGTYRRERYDIQGTFSMVGQASDLDAREVMDEIDRTLRYYNIDNSHSYEYEFSYSLFNDSGDIWVEFNILMVKLFVNVTVF